MPNAGHHRKKRGNGWRRAPLLELVTVTNDANRAWRLLQTAPLPVRVLGPLGNSSAQFSDYLRDAHLLLHVRDLIRRGLNDTVVMLLDAWDVAWLGCERDLLASFESLGRPLFFSAELGFYPFGAKGFAKLLVQDGAYPFVGASPDGVTYESLQRCSSSDGAQSVCRPHADSTWDQCSFCVPKAVGGGYKFLNNGCWGGYAWALERALSRMYSEGQWRALNADHSLMRGLSWRGIPDLSQGGWHAYLLAHSEEVALDYGADLCLNLHGLDVKESLELHHRDDGSTGIFSHAFQKDVCFAHANGGTGVNTLDALLATLPHGLAERSTRLHQYR